MKEETEGRLVRNKDREREKKKKEQEGTKQTESGQV